MTGLGKSKPKIPGNSTQMITKMITFNVSFCFFVNGAASGIFSVPHYTLFFLQIKYIPKKVSVKRTRLHHVLQISAWVTVSESKNTW